MEKEAPLPKGVWSKLQNLIWLNSEQSTIAPPQSVELKKLNNEVFEVCKPSGSNHDGNSLGKGSSSRPSVEIVFFHGLQLEKTDQPHVTTWLSRCKSKFWLNWLHDEIPNARILTVSYDAAVTETDTEGRMDLFMVAENLVTSLTSASVGQSRCPVVLVGHCLGGLVMKEVCDRANGIVRRHLVGAYSVLENFLDSVKGFFYYSTPHHGVHLPVMNSLTGPLVGEFHIFHPPTARRNEDFRTLRQTCGWRAAAVRGNHKVRLKDFGGFVFDVPEASARYDIDPTEFYTVGAHHFDVCRPVDKTCPIFLKLRHFLDNFLDMQPESSPESPDFTVGLDERISKVLRVLQIEGYTIQSGVKGILLHGIGGIGKTTLGEAVCAKIPIDSKFKAQVEMGLNPSAEKICSLQAFIYKTLSGKPGDICSCKEGRALLKAYFARCTSPVLLFIDNVFEEQDLQNLLPRDLRLPDKSRVVVVSRRETVCNKLPKDITYNLYPVEGLSRLDSEKLFYYHLGNCPPARKKDVPTILQVCGDLPLALELVGGHLSDEKVKTDFRVWNAAIEGLKKCHFDNNENPDGDRLHVAVRWSFDRLNEGTKKVFRDILLFRNEKWKWAERLGNASQLKSLADYSLIKKKEDSTGSRIQIHDLLAALGSFEAKSTTETRVLVEEGESLQKFLENDSQPRHTIEAFVLRYWRNKWDFRAEDLDAMHTSLRIIAISVPLQGFPEYCDGRINGTCQKSKVPKCLEICSFQGNRYVDREMAFPYTNISGMEQLRVLRLICCTVDGLEEVQMPPNLQVVKFQHLSGFRYFHPDAFARCTHLHTLILRRCDDLELIPPSFAGLDDLRTIVIYANYRLETVPSFSKFLSLEKLEVEQCPHIASASGVGNFSLLRTLVLPVTGVDTLPEGVGCLESLATLRLDCTDTWRQAVTTAAFLGGIGNLSHLKEFELGGFNQLETLPDEFGDLHSLEEFSTYFCGFTTLPRAVCNLKHLRRLIISYCKQLHTLPEDICGLESLEDLIIYEVALTTLPRGIGKLSKLQILAVQECGSLEMLPDELGSLSNLRLLNLEGCEKLRTLPSSILGRKRLMKLSIEGCEQLLESEVVDEAS